MYHAIIIDPCDVTHRSTSQVDKAEELHYELKSKGYRAVRCYGDIHSEMYAVIYEHPECRF